MRSVKARLALVFVVLTAGFLCVLSTSIYFMVGNRWDEELDRQLDAERSEFAAHFQDEYDEFLRGIYKELAPELDDFTKLSGTLTEVSRTDGARLYISKGFEPVFTGDRIHAEFNGAPYRGTRGRIVTPRGEEFMITAAISEEHYLAQLEQLRTYFAFFCPLVLAIAWIVGYLFVARTLAPVEEMRRLAERISRENLSERIPEPASRGEFRDLARTLNDMLGRLGRAIEDLEMFAADAAHELRTPLSNLRAEFETLIQEPRTVEEYETALGSFSQDLDRMNRVVADLFILAKLDMRQYALQREPVHLSSVLGEARETWQGMADEKGVEIRLSDGDAVVMGDPLALRRVALNLMENAIKYNRSGGRVTLSVERQNGSAVIRVRDTGIGIAAKHIPNLFRRFYRIDKARSRETGGAGLGLAICKSFVEAHGGAIRVTSTPGGETEFAVELPLDGAAPTTTA